MGQVNFTGVLNMSNTQMTNINKDINKLCHDFVDARISVILSRALVEDKSYKDTERQYGALINKIYDEMGFQFGTDCENLLSNFLDVQTSAVYRQGFNDALALLERPKEIPDLHHLALRSA